MDEQVLPFGDETLMSEKEAGRYYGVKPGTFQKWRHLGVGPEYVVIGPGIRGVRYKFGVLRQFNTRSGP